MTRRLGNNTLSFAVAVGGILAVASAFIAPTSAIGQSRPPMIGFTAAQANGFFSHQGQAGKISPLDV